MNIWIFVILAVVIITIGIVWFLLEPREDMPADMDEKELLIWQAEHGNEWAQTVLTLMEGNHHLFEMIAGYKAIIEDARIEITTNNPAHVQLNTAMEELHNWIARTYNKEEC